MGFTDCAQKHILEENLGGNRTNEKGTDKPVRNSSSPRRAIPDSYGRSHRSSRRGLKWVILLVILVLIGGGGAGAYFTGLLDPLIERVIKLLPNSGNHATPDVQEVPQQWPLTGITGQIELRPGLIVEVENSSENRPLIGIEAADYVIEEAAGEGSTRLSLVFNSKVPTEVSTLGNLTPTYENRWSEGFVVLGSGQTPATYVLDPDPQLPPKLADFDLEGRGCTAQRHGAMTNEILIQLPPSIDANWTWDITTSLWQRSESEQPAVSASGSQITATNIIILDVDLGPDTGSGPQPILTGQGTGAVASGGMSASITWSRDYLTSMWEFTDADGEPVVLLPGTTWIEIIPKGAGEWYAF